MNVHHCVFMQVLMSVMERSTAFVISVDNLFETFFVSEHSGGSFSSFRKLFNRVSFVSSASQTQAYLSTELRALILLTVLVEKKVQISL